MPEGQNKGGEQQPAAPAADPFGVRVDASGKDVGTAKPAEQKPEDKKPEGGDVENHPLVKELRTQIDSIKTEYGDNLKGQRGIIERLEKEIIALKGGKKPDGGKGEDDAEVPFKEIRTSKDLKQDERDDMTEAEIRQMDAIAALQTTINGLVKGMAKKEQEKGGDEHVEDLNTAAKTRALVIAETFIKDNPAIAKTAKDLANLIIVEFNEFNNTNITPEQMETRLQKALKNVPNYTPPKEQESKGGQGGAIKTGAGGKDDPFGVGKVIADMQGENKGTYNL